MSDRSVEVAALVLAAGRSQRMGANKLVIPVNGHPMARHVVQAAVASRVRLVRVILGYEAPRLRKALSGLDVQFIANPDYSTGLSSSIRQGIAGLSSQTEGAIICLGDMPGIDAALLNRMIDIFHRSGKQPIVIPRFDGRRGNPVLWPRRFFSELATLSGDSGAKHLVTKFAAEVVEIEASNDAVLVDLDTPDALREWNARYYPDVS